MAWLATTSATLAPATTGAYVNYIDPAQPDFLNAYYGANLARLVDVKRAVDPDDVFHFAQSIPTALPA
jgi:FAD/FMN-containing dehydrogenase